MDINLEWYRVFYWIAKTGSLTAAAAKLHITQPAVSHTVKQLEERLGGPLFFRTPKGVRLTAEGEVLLRHVEQVFVQVHLGEKALAGMHDLQAGEVHIGASDTLCKHYLLPHLETFHERHPRIRIHVTNRTTPETIALLKEGRIDFGVVSLPAPDSAAADKTIELQPRSPLADCLVGGKRYRELAGQALPLRELAHYPLLQLEPGGSTRQAIDRHLAGHGVAIEPEFELGSIDLLVQFAIRGFGLAFAIREYIGDELESGRLVEIPLDPPMPPRGIGIAVLRGVPLSAAAKACLATLP